MSHQFNQVIPWYILKAHLESLQKQLDSKLRKAKPDEILRLQGRSEQVEELLNLPNTLSEIQEADIQVAKEKIAKS